MNFCIFIYQISKCLLEEGAKIDTGDVVKFSPLHLACHFGHEKVLKSHLCSGKEKLTRYESMSSYLMLIR